MVEDQLREHERRLVALIEARDARDEELARVAQDRDALERALDEEKSGSSQWGDARHAQQDLGGAPEQPVLLHVARIVIERHFERQWKPREPGQLVTEAHTPSKV